mmetsp:Transcript_1845/g.3876  ORF Transcript_1845/g.3876 Transcript_1845/m.3876 type:complete len:88 (-) Transcript_1845:208-471(-)
MLLYHQGVECPPTWSAPLYLSSASAAKRLKKASTGSDTKRQLKKLQTQVAALTACQAADPDSDASDEENAAPTKATKRSACLKSLKR